MLLVHKNMGIFGSKYNIINNKTNPLSKNSVPTGGTSTGLPIYRVDYINLGIIKCNAKVKHNKNIHTKKLSNQSR